MPTWDFNNPGGQLKDYLNELAMWKRQGTVPPWNQGTKLYKSFKIGSKGRLIANQLTPEIIESDKGFDLIVEKIKEHFAKFLEAELEVQAELSMYQTVRENRQTFMEFTGHLLRKLTDFETAIGEKIPPKIKGLSLIHI